MRNKHLLLHPLGVPADLKSAVKNVRPIKPRGFVIPQQQQKEKHTPLLRIPNPQSLNRLGHFFLHRISNPAGRLADLRSLRFTIRINIW